jgi:hypothetical protein
MVGNLADAKETCVKCFILSYVLIRNHCEIFILQQRKPDETYEGIEQSRDSLECFVMNLIWFVCAEQPKFVPFQTINFSVRLTTLSVSLFQQLTRCSKWDVQVQQN